MSTEVTAEVRAEWRREAVKNADAPAAERILDNRILALLEALEAAEDRIDEPRKRWLSDREYVIDNPSPTDEGGEGA